MCVDLYSGENQQSFMEKGPFFDETSHGTLCSANFSVTKLSYPQISSKCVQKNINTREDERLEPKNPLNLKKQIIWTIHLHDLGFKMIMFQGINISHLGKRKIIFKYANHQGDMGMALKTLWIFPRWSGRLERGGYVKGHDPDLTFWAAAIC